MKFLLLSMALVFCTTMAVAAETPVLLGDNNTSHSSVRLSTNFTALGENIYFSGEGAHGFELYRSNSLSGIVSLVRDIEIGKNSSYPSDFTLFQNALYFSADKGDSGRRLWKCNINTPGALEITAEDYVTSYVTVRNLCVGDNALFYTVSAGTTQKLYKSDGTSSGTEKFGDFDVSGVPFSNRGIVYFHGKTGAEPMATWRTNGTIPGTYKIQVPTSSGTINQFDFRGEVNGFLYLNGSDGVNNGLWATTDFSSTAEFLGNITLNNNVAATSNTVFFAGTAAGPSYGLWKTDGTATGTVQLKQFSGSGSIYGLTPLANKLAFAATESGSYRPWISDGTVIGTTLLSSLPISNANYLTAVGDSLYFSGNIAGFGDEVLMSDGTDAGTTVAMDILPGAIGSIPYGMKAIGNRIYLSVVKGVQSDFVLSYDTTSNQMSRLESFHLSDFEMRNVKTVDNVLYFSGWDGLHGWEPWISDGTPAGTHMISDVQPGEHSSNPQGFAVSGNSVYFAAQNINGKYDLWRADATGNNASFVDSMEASEPINIVSVDNAVYVNANPDLPGGGINTANLWRSDGTDTGTYIVDSNIYAGSLESLGTGAIYIKYGLHKADAQTSALTSLTPPVADLADINTPPTFAHLNGQLYFRVRQSSYQLWKTDGTPGGTINVPIAPTTLGGLFTLSPPVNNKLFFVQDDHLWIHSGTANSGVKLIWAGAISNFGFEAPRAEVASLNSNFVHAGYGTSGLQPYVSTGALNGTSKLKDISVNNIYGSSPNGFTTLQNMVYFAATDDAHGTELWRTDGTTSGTLLVADIYPGSTGSGPNQFTVLYDRFYFTANSPGEGMELYSISNSESQPTLHEVWPGTENAGPQLYGVIDGSVIFEADTMQYGRELWSLSAPDNSGVSDWTLY